MRKSVEDGKSVPSYLGVNSHLSTQKRLKQAASQAAGHNKMRKRKQNVKKQVDSEDDDDPDEPAEYQDSSDDWIPQEPKSRLRKKKTLLPVKRRKTKVKANSQPATKVNITMKSKPTSDDKLQDRQSTVPLEPEDDYEKFKYKDVKALFKIQRSRPLHNYPSGSFVVLKTDLVGGLGANATACLWRIDGSTLLQKYVAELSDEDKDNKEKQMIYCATPVYTGWDTESHNLYERVTVKVQKIDGRKSERVVFVSK